MVLAARPLHCVVRVLCREAQAETTVVGVHHVEQGCAALVIEAAYVSHQWRFHSTMCCQCR